MEPGKTVGLTGNWEQWIPDEVAKLISLAVNRQEVRMSL